MTLRALMLPILLVFVAPAARVRSQKPDVAGFFTNMYASSRTGDIGGATIFISWAKVHNGLEERYRSEEHTSELQSPYDLVCRLLLEKKKKKQLNTTYLHKLTKIISRLAEKTADFGSGLAADHVRRIVPTPAMVLSFSHIKYVVRSLR